MRPAPVRAGWALGLAHPPAAHAGAPDAVPRAAQRPLLLTEKTGPPRAPAKTEGCRQPAGWTGRCTGTRSSTCCACMPVCSLRARASVCVQASVCAGMHTCLCVHSCAQACVRVRKRLHVQARVRVYVSFCMSVYTRMHFRVPPRVSPCSCLYVCACACVCAPVRLRTRGQSPRLRTRSGGGQRSPRCCFNCENTGGLMSREPGLEPGQSWWVGGLCAAESWVRAGGPPGLWSWTSLRPIRSEPGAQSAQVSAPTGHRSPRPAALWNLPHPVSAPDTFTGWTDGRTWALPHPSGSREWG